MPYTLAKWALWLVGAAVVGLVVGWLLGRLSAQRELTVPDGHPDDLSTDTLPGASGASGVVTAPASNREVERLRLKLTELESVAIERDRLVWELAEVRAAATNAVPTEVVFEPIDTATSEALAAMSAERDALAAKVGALEQAVSELRVRVWNAEAQVTEARQQSVATHVEHAPALAAAARPSLPRRSPDPAPVRLAPPPRPDVSAGEQVLGAPLRFDDLTAIEGIGPHIAQLCAARGIDSWWAMANTEVDRLRRMLSSAGPRFQVSDPETWPEQARLLALGQWAEFVRLTRSQRASKAGE